MNIYDLNQTHYLRHDIENVLAQINIRYEVQIGNNDNEFIPRTVVSKKNSRVSPQCQATFNKTVPVIKSLTRDMYSILEAIYKGNNGTFDKIELEGKYPNLKELRLLNNKFKHYFDTEPQISVVALTLLEPIGHRIDVMIQYNYKDGKIATIRFSELVRCFLLILEELKIINIERK